MTIDLDNNNNNNNNNYTTITLQFQNYQMNQIIINAIKLILTQLVQIMKTIVPHNTNAARFTPNLRSTPILDLKIHL